MVPRVCPFCGWAFDLESKFCPSCGCQRRPLRSGQDVPARPGTLAMGGAAGTFCPQCGHSNTARATLCASCGHPLVQNIPPPLPPRPLDRPASETARTPQPPVSAPPVAPPPVPLATAPEEPAASPPLGAGAGLRDGRYVVERHLGGAAYLARDRAVPGRFVVIVDGGHTGGAEQADTEPVEEERATALTALQIPHVPRVTDVFTDAGRHLLARDFVEGTALREIIASAGGPLPEKQVMSWASEVLVALGALEKQAPWLIPAAITPAQIVVDTHKHAWLLIAGTSATRDSPATGKNVGLVGRPARTEVVPSALYTLGTTLHSLLAWRVPGAAAEAPHLTPSLSRQLNPGLSQEGETVIARATHRHPGSRYRSVAEMQKDVDAVLHRSTVGSLLRGSPVHLRGTSVRARRALAALLIALVVAGIVGGASLYVAQHQGSGAAAAAPALSDGAVALDLDREGHRATALNPAAWAALKQQAAAALRGGDKVAAAADFARVTANDPTDAEAWIYQENLRALAAARAPYRIAVGGSFSGANAATGREVLEGVYTAQKEINDAGGIDGHLLSLVLADDRSSEAGALRSARAIAAQNTVLAVVGYRYSARAAVALPVLAAARIAMVTPTAGSPNLNTNPYFFRVCPSDTYQGVQAAHYMIASLLHGRMSPLIAVFADPGETYSSGLSTIVSSVAQDSGARILPESYTVGTTTDFGPQVRDVLAHRTALIYFAGYAHEALLLARALDAAGAPPGLPIMTDDGFYNPSEFLRLPGHKSRFHFTSFFYPDEWRLVQDPVARRVIVDMEARYVAHFHRAGTPFGGYGTSRVAAGTALSYDALHVIATALRAAGTVPTRATVSHALADLGVTAPPYQGVTGRTAFAANGDPVDKALVLMHLDPRGYTKMDGFLGTFK